MSSIIFCDQSCQYLSMTEKEQNEKRLNHIDHLCKISADNHERLIHEEHHPALVAGKNCFRHIATCFKCDKKCICKHFDMIGNLSSGNIFDSIVVEDRANIMAKYCEFYKLDDKQKE